MTSSWSDHGPIRTGCTYLRSVSYKLVARNLSYLISGLHMQFISRLISKISRPCARNFWKFQNFFGLASLGFVNAKKNHSCCSSSRRIQN